MHSTRKDGVTVRAVKEAGGCSSTDSRAGEGEFSRRNEWLNTTGKLFNMTIEKWL